MDEAWRDGFADNLDATALAAVAERLERFVGLFGDMHEGDRVWLDFVPGAAPRCASTASCAGSVPGGDFNAALLAVWLGREAGHRIAQEGYGWGRYNLRCQPISPRPSRNQMTYG